MSGISVRRGYPMLGPADLDAIHGAALEGLERVGVRIGTARGRRLLQEAGARIDEATHIAKIPAAVIEESRSRIPSEVVLFGRNPAWDAQLDLEHVHITNDGNGPLAIDWQTGERRPSTSKDLERCALVSNALENLHVFWPMVPCQDAPASVRTLVDLKTSLIWNDKHVEFATAVTPQEARHLTAMAAAVMGDHKELRRRPIISSVHTSIAPLQHDARNMDTAMAFGEAGVPVSIFTMPSPGVSGPVTLAGSLVVAAMEFLSGLAMCQLANPGCPVIWGTGVAPLDMKTATRAGGGPEEGMTGAAVTELAHFYGVPSLCGGFVSTASAPGTQAAMEKFVSGLSLVLARADMICGIGLLEDCRTLWLEQLFIEDEMISMIRRVADGIAVTEETLALDVIEKVGVGGTFLGQRHTMNHLKREHFLPKLLDRRAYDLWVADGRRSMEDRARALVREALEREPPNPLDADVVTEFDRIIGEARRLAPLAA